LLDFLLSPLTFSVAAPPVVSPAHGATPVSPGKVILKANKVMPTQASGTFELIESHLLLNIPKGI
jgi:hypothetical protein